MMLRGGDLLKLSECLKMGEGYGQIVIQLLQWLKKFNSQFSCSIYSILGKGVG